MDSDQQVLPIMSDSSAREPRKKLWFDTMKELNFHHEDPEPWGRTTIVLWTIAAVLAGIDLVLFFLRT
jgi:hypothetical protein